MRQISLFILFALLSSVQILVAQSGSGFITVTSNADHVAVYADTLYLGDADGSFFSLPVGRTSISVIRHEDIASWDSPKPSKIVKIVAGDSLRIELLFPNIYRFNSFPMGAKVRNEEGVEIGVTPFIYTSADIFEGRLSFSKSGYEDRVLERVEHGNTNVILTVIDTDGEVSLEAFKRKPQPVRGKLVTASIMAGTAIAAGLSIHYKFKADRLYDEYVDITDPALRPDILKYDRYAGAALGAMQGGLVLLAVRLAF